MLVTIEIMLVEYEVFLDELVIELVTKHKKTSPVLKQLFPSALEDPHTEYNSRSLIRLSEICEMTHFRIDPVQLRTGAETLQRRYKEKLEIML